MAKMRMPGWMVLSALSGVMLLPACGPGYGRGMTVGVQVQSRPGLEIYGYNARQYGDWRASYRQWTPVVVYESNGQYYPTNIRGARQVQVYRSQSGYFMPPRDQEWARTDRRFNNKRRPTDDDYGRARSHPND
jgi:hypothetical protein